MEPWDTAGNIHGTGYLKAHLVIAVHKHVLNAIVSLVPGFIKSYYEVPEHSMGSFIRSCDPRTATTTLPQP